MTRMPADLDLQALVEESYLLKAEKCRRSFFYFVQEFWENVSAETPVYNWHIPYLCRELSKVAYQAIARYPKLYDLIINIPPGTTKSTVATILLIPWVWIARLPKEMFPEVYEAKEEMLRDALRDDPSDNLLADFERFMRIGITGLDSRFITGSYSAPLSLEHAEYSRDVILSDKYRLYFPEVQIKADKNLKSNYKNTSGGQRFSTSVGATVTGVHGLFLVIDDPLNPEKSISDPERYTANYWMDKTLSTRKVDKKITPTILIMQRLHQDDCTGNMLSKRNKKIRHIKLPGSTEYEIKPASLKKKYDAVGGFLDAKRMPQKVLDEMMLDLGSYGYAGQVGQDPRPRQGGMFQEEWFEIVDAAPSSSIPIVRGWDLAATTLKEAKKQNSRPAFTAGVKMSWCDGIFYIHHISRFRASAHDVRIRMLNLATQDGLETLIDFPQDPGQAGKGQARDIVAFLVGYNVRFSLESGDKVLRADPFSAQCEAGNVKLVRGAWVQPFLDEAAFFPNGFKDQIDAAVRAFTRLQALKKQQGEQCAAPVSVPNARNLDPEAGEN